MFDLTQQQAKYLDEKESFLDKFIDQDDEQALFTSSYIHGHFSVVAAKLSASDLADGSSFEVLFQQTLVEDIDDAIKKNELSSEDALAVQVMLYDMFNTLE